MFGGIAVFLWAFIFSVSQSLTQVTGTANMLIDLAAGIGVGLAGGLLGALAVWLLLYFVMGRRHTAGGKVLLAVLALIALVGAVPASGFRVVGAGMGAEQKAVEAIRQRGAVRRDALIARVEAQRDAVVDQDFFEPHDLAEPGGLTRARGKLTILRGLGMQAVASQAQLQAQARAEVAALPVSGPRRDLMLQGFDTAAAAEAAEEKIGVELSHMLFDQMDAQLDVLERRRWVVEYGQIAFTSEADMNDFNTRALRVQEITAELERQRREQVRRQNAPLVRR